ncbi:MAG: hypothetical protein MK212_06595 [Saprospiraceae bacterium]|nr:hypothetical protein [Saprospiraceae bacterium]
MHKLFFLSLLFILILVHSISAQWEWAESDTFAFAQLTLSNPDNSPYANSPVRLVGTKKGQIFKGVTNNQGKVKIKVTYDDLYDVYCGKHRNYKQIIIRNVPYVTHSLKSYIYRHVVFTFAYKTYDGKPLVGEWVNVKGTKSDSIYTDTTDADGLAKFYMPLRDLYTISVKYKPNFRQVQAGERGQARTLMSTTFNWIGSKEKERRAAIADSIAKARQARILALIDSLGSDLTPDEFEKIGRYLDFDLYIPVVGNTDWIEKCIRFRAAAYQEQLDKDKDFFEKQKKIILASLLRIQKKMGHKIVVTDVTCSMNPYQEQVLIWHALNTVEGKTNTYLFFNDGDGRANSTKEIGKTGGLHFCQGNVDDLVTVIEALGKSVMCSGDSPENDIEALLAAQNKSRKYDEIILIADNFSPMRDYSLMTELKVPIRIILCGVEANFKGSLPSEVNEEYLDLAYITGGSVHTITEDIWDLNKAVDGGKLKINGVEYKLENGRFTRISKL